MKKSVLVIVTLALLAMAVVPFTASAATGVTYSAGFQLQNLSASQAAIVVDFYLQDGTQPANSSVSDTIPANSSKTYFPLSTVPDGFNGSAVVSSDQQLASITNVLGNGGQRGDSYAGFSAGATTVNVPLVFKSYYNNDSWFNVQNVGSADASVTVHYIGTSGSNPVDVTEGPVTVKANASHTFDQNANTNLPANFVGAASVSSTQAVAAVVSEIGAKNMLMYTGFIDNSQNPVMPLVMANNYNNSTGIQIQNTGNASTDVTVSYTPAGSGTACTEQHTIAAGKSVTFGFPMPAACGSKFVGSAKVTANSASQGLVAIVNQINSALANASAYSAFNAANATAHVSLPLIMDRNYGLYTGISVVNMGAQPTNISCTFSGSSYTASASNVAPGAALVDVQGGKIADKYVGSAVCTATGGDAKIAAIVNQTKTAAADQDVLYSYPGFNY